MNPYDIQFDPGAAPILLAFSGGLDTSFCVPWLKETYGRPVITVTVDTGGTRRRLADCTRRALGRLGAPEHHLIDARAAYFDQVLKYLIMGTYAAAAPIRVRRRRARSASADHRPNGVVAQDTHGGSRLHGGG